MRRLNSGWLAATTVNPGAARQAGQHDGGAWCEL